MNNQSVTTSVRWVAILGLVLTVTFWAGNSIVARLAATDIPPVALNFWRWMLALMWLLPFTGKDLIKSLPVAREHWRYLLLQASLSIALFNSLQYLAAHTTPAINLNLVNSTNPVFTFFMSWLLLRQVASGIQLLGLMTAITGLIVTVSGGSIQQLLTLELNIGDLWMLLAVIAWATYSVMLRRSPFKLAPLSFLTLLIVVGLLLQLPVYLLEFWWLGGFSLNQENILSLAYVSIFPSVLSYYFWIRGVATLGPIVASMFIYLAPPIAAVLAWVFLGEGLGWHHLFGEVLIIIGFILTVVIPSGRSAKSKG